MDHDGDGLTDLEEFNFGTLYVINIDYLNPDTDGDGLSDGQEIENGSSPNSVDTDLDGVNDKIDSEPTVKDSFAPISLILMVEHLCCRMAKNSIPGE